MRRLLVRANATRYVLIMALSFAVSVVVTRWYLELTGYPQLGNDTFHIAHALWGGLLQVIAALILFIFVNRWVMDLSAVLAGVGVGLFIDEIGKFITRQNDYFFPLAAPIIYVVFLLTLLVYLVIERRQMRFDDLRVDMYQVLTELEEVLEADLSQSEYDLITRRLQRIAGQTARPDLAALAQHILTFLESGVVNILPDKLSVVERLRERLKQFEARYLSQAHTRQILTLLLFVDGIGTLFVMTVLGAAAFDYGGVPDLIETIVLDQSTIRSATSLSWYLIMMALHVVTGALLTASATAFLVKRDRLAVATAMIGLVIMLTFINTLSFYYNQFSVVLNSFYVFFLMLFLQRYYHRFLRRRPTESGHNQSADHLQIGAHAPEA